MVLRPRPKILALRPNIPVYTLVLGLLLFYAFDYNAAAADDDDDDEDDDDYDGDL